MAQDADRPRGPQMLQFLYKLITKQSIWKPRAPHDSGGRSTQGLQILQIHSALYIHINIALWHPTLSGTRPLWHPTLYIHINIAFHTIASKGITVVVICHNTFLPPRAKMWAVIQYHQPSCPHVSVHFHSLPHDPVRHAIICMDSILIHTDSAIIAAHC